MTPDRDLTRVIALGLSDVSEPRLGLAVSGGGDSVAMLRLVANWAQHVSLFVYTVDHGLRPEAADEARLVAALCRELGCEHRILKWSGWDGTGNLSAQARAARYQLIANAARSDGVGSVLLAHTADDQAETVLMGIARRSGVDGLSGMAARRTSHGIAWLRPLLGVSRADLRDYLKTIDQPWVDDPTNDDDHYERVRMRKAQGALDALGLTSGALGDLARHMQDARQALDATTRDAADALCLLDRGTIRIDKRGFRALPHEIRRRLLKRALAFVAPLATSPRREAMAAVIAPDHGDKDASLGGCLVLFKPRHIWVVREPNAVQRLESDPAKSWDGKWQIKGPQDTQGCVIRALQEKGLSCLPDWRDAGLPRPALLSSPSIWLDERLIAAPLVRQDPDWSAEMILNAEDFLSYAASH